MVAPVMNGKAFEFRVKLLRHYTNTVEMHMMPLATAYFLVAELLTYPPEANVRRESFASAFPVKQNSQ